MKLPSEPNSQSTMVSGTTKCDVFAGPEEMSQPQIEPSFAPLIKVTPLVMRDKLHTSLLLPRRILFGRGLSASDTSQRRMVSSPLADTSIFPSGEKAIAVIDPLAACATQHSRSVSRLSTCS